MTGNSVKIAAALLAAAFLSIAGASMSFNVISATSALISGTGAGTSCPTYGPVATSAPAGAINLTTSSNVSSVVNGAAAGATFYFAPGVYRGVTLGPKDNQTFIGAQGAILNGSNLLTGWTFDGTNYWIGGQTQEGYRHTGSVGEPGSMRHNYPEAVYIDNVPLTAVDALAKVAIGKFYFDYAADRIYIRDNPAGKTVETTSGPEGPFQGGGNGVTVSNFVVEKYANPIQAGVIDSKGKTGWIITNNETRLNHSLGVHVDGPASVIGNYIQNNGQMGAGGNGNNITFENNKIANNGWWSGIDPFWEGGGTKFSDGNGLIVRNNYTRDNKGMGLWTDINNINSLYENNTIINNTTGGISHEISYAATIRNNVLIKNGWLAQGWMFGAAIQIQNSKNVQVYGNKVDVTGATKPAGFTCPTGGTCDGNGIGLIQQDRGTGTFGVWETTGNNIHDNIVVSQDNTGTHGGVADFNSGVMFPGGNVWANNSYFTPDTGNRFWWNDGETNFAGFKSASGETGTISQSYPNTSTWVTCP